MIFLLALNTCNVLCAVEKTTKSDLSRKLEDKKYFYSALNEFFNETFSQELTNDDLKRLEDLLFFTGIEILDDYEPSLLKKYPTSSTQFILARKEYHSKNYRPALELFGKVHPDHRYYPEAKLLEAQVFDRLKKVKERENAFESCLNSAKKNEASAKTEKIARYYHMVYEICLVNKARYLFQNEKYEQAIEEYNKVSKTSYKWPYLLLEKAWAYYQLGDYNRVLGLLTTYKSPLLDSYFFPEAEYLSALSYFRLCLFDDSLTIINQFYQVYRPRFQQLESVLKRNRSSQDYFYNLMFKPQDEIKDQKEFFQQILTRMKKQTRFSLDFNSIHRIDQEILQIKRNETPLIRDKLLSHLFEVKTNLVSKINYNAKTDIFQFFDSIPFLSQELFKLNLEIISQKKDLIYSNKKLIADRSRGDLSNVKRNKFEYFWTFEGSFWADELGDYSMGLKSNCKTVRNETMSEE